MTSKVFSLPLKEAPTVQGDAIQVLQQSLGKESSRDVVERAVYEISDRLCRLELALYQGELETVAKLAAGLVGMSTQIGLPVFAEVARCLALAIQERNLVDAAALSGRLLRLGESSLFCVVEMAGRSG